MSEIINNQKSVEISIEAYLPFWESALEAIPECLEKSATFSFVSDEKMRELNKTFRDKDSTTDVLSFRFSPEEFEDQNYLGDIIISTDRAREQAIENDNEFELEIKQLILHGLLHLVGYDHETDDGEMNGLELRLRDKLEIS